MTTTEDLPGTSLTVPAATSLPLGPYEQAVTRLRGAQHEFAGALVVDVSLVMKRNVAVVQALQAGVPAAVVQQVTRMGDAALELAVARGTYHRDHVLRAAVAEVR